MTDEAVAALRTGKPVILPTDTVYGLCADAYRAEATRRAYRLKGRPDTQPSALLAVDVDMLFECVPELRGRSGVLARALLPGPFTVILPNPARRFRWLTGSNENAIGVRVPELEGPGLEVLERVGAVMATSANLAGGPDPRRVDDIPDELRSACGAVVDGGELPGVPSTVVDCTGPEPRLVREGAVASADAIARARAALA